MDTMSSQSAEARIEAITGELLSGVAFIQDYVEFHFDGKILRSLTVPTLSIGSARYTFPETGSRDAMCSLIGRAVEQVVVDDTNEIRISFSGGGGIHIPLGAKDRPGPEAAHYVPGQNRPIAVW